jgi:asparagine synthase (glutamine-hydrolysing)
VADILVRTWPRPVRDCPSPGGVPDYRTWHEQRVLIRTRDGAGTIEYDVYDGTEGLCVVLGRVEAESAVDLFRCYRTSGAAAVAGIDGQFVVLLHDRVRNETCVIRDKVGFGHVYYWTRGDEFGASTNLPWLVRDAAEHGTPPRPSGPGVAMYLTYQYVPAPHSIVADVVQLPPGAVLCAGSDRRVEAIRIASFPLPPTGIAELEPREEPIRDHGRRIVDLIAQAATDGLVGAEKVGMMLSGGIDTSTNAVLMVDRLGLRPVGFTAAFDEAFYDETPFAANVAEHLGVKHVPVAIRPESITILPDVARAFETPNADQAAFAEHLLAQEVREHGCDVVVTGEGGDEVLGWPQSRSDDRNFAELPNEPEQLARYYLGRTDLASASLRATIFRHLGVEPDLAYQPLAEKYQEYASWPVFDRLLFGQWRTWLVDGVYMKDSRVFQHFGLRPVFPMMSTELMRYVAALPTPVKLAGLHDKRFLRTTAGTRFPAVVLGRPKHKFWLPVAEWFRGPSRDFLLDHVLSDGFVTNTFGKALVGQLVIEHERIEADHSRVLWALLFLELWWNEHLRL